MILAYMSVEVINGRMPGVGGTGIVIKLSLVERDGDSVCHSIRAGSLIEVLSFKERMTFARSRTKTNFKNNTL
jgi:hypothetical protein